MKVKFFLIITTMLLIMVLSFTACTDSNSGDVTSDVLTDAETVMTTIEEEMTEEEKPSVNETTVAPESAVVEETTEEITTEEITTEEITTEEVTTEEPDIMIDVTLDAPYAEDFTVSKVFGSNMVVQRGERLRVWGWADESENGKKVSGEFMGMFSEAIVEDGKWTITFKAKLEASAEMGNTMKIYTDKKTVEFKDVLVGDVYMVIGQSNVAYDLRSHQSYYGNSGKGGADTLDYDAPIRIHLNNKYDSIHRPDKYPPLGTADVSKDVASGRIWEIPSKNNLPDFSAIGYFFAHHMIEMNGKDVPIGVIAMGAAGLPLGAFMSNEVADAQGTDTFDTNKGHYVTTGLDNEYGRFMYNNHIYPFENYAIAGIVWYQGESDYMSGNADKYAVDFTALMNYMRSTHNLTNPNFPVFVIEFPSITGSFDLGPIRAKMGRIPQLLENSYYCVSSDLSELQFPDNLHPHCKYEQGERLAKLASAVVMNSITLEEATGPILESFEFTDNGRTVVLKFKNYGEGLRTADGTAEVKGFVGIIGRTSSCVDVTARITGVDTITVTSQYNLIGVAYNYVENNMYGRDVTLCSSNGNPASAFWARKTEDIEFYVSTEHATANGGLTITSDNGGVSVDYQFKTNAGFSAIAPKLGSFDKGDEVIVSIFAFDTDRATTLASAPIKTWKLEGVEDGWTLMTLDAPVPAGEYIVLIAPPTDKTVDNVIWYKYDAVATKHNGILTSSFEDATRSIPEFFAVFTEEVADGKYFGKATGPAAPIVDISTEEIEISAVEYATWESDGGNPMYADKINGIDMIKDFRPGHVITYKINVLEEGTYNFAVKYTCMWDAFDFSIYVDGVKVGVVTHDPAKYVNLSVPVWTEPTQIKFTKGEHTIDITPETIGYFWSIKIGPEGDEPKKEVADITGEEIELNAVKYATWVDDGWQPMYADKINGVDVLRNFYAGDTIEYKINLLQGGSYDFAIKCACMWGDAPFTIYVDDVETGVVYHRESNYINLDTPVWTEPDQLELTEGEHTIKITFASVCHFWSIKISSETDNR